MINEAMCNLIVVLHLIFVLFIVLAPFIGNNYFLILHSIVVPFMMAHWYTNNNNCALTVIERNIRKNMNGVETDPDDCFTHNLIAPVYDFKKNNADFTTFIYLITFILWFISLYKLYDNRRNGKLQRLEHLILY